MSYLQKIKLSWSRLQVSVRDLFSPKPIHFTDKFPFVDNADVVCSKNTLEDLTTIVDTQGGSDSNFKMQLYKISSELNQCKELLRVQYTLNNKYKVEVRKILFAYSLCSFND